MIAEGGAENLVPALGVHGDPPAACAGGRVNDDRRAAHASQHAPGTPARRACYGGSGHIAGVGERQLTPGPGVRGSPRRGSYRERPPATGRAQWTGHAVLRAKVSADPALRGADHLGGAAITLMTRRPPQPSAVHPWTGCERPCPSAACGSRSEAPGQSPLPGTRAPRSRSVHPCRVTPEVSARPSMGVTRSTARGVEAHACSTNSVSCTHFRRKRSRPFPNSRQYLVPFRQRRHVRISSAGSAWRLDLPSARVAVTVDRRLPPWCRRRLR